MNTQLVRNVQSSKRSMGRIERFLYSPNVYQLTFCIRNTLSRQRQTTGRHKYL